ncbi:hypothetical protein CLV84_0242 [Neolewinella xylanilytica]|uniref:MetA-pathway of phenol degradation n=1 Tax=Neolewinella xylanilytica TaxID=1514080 RepID=A0A2S6I726_9BACT|nr:hypothetical protein [Neolewinella xylanilytica]PPK87304.1 hypothetical protein CLV84_0242 [Neolewinella xylanilytica]
MHRPTLPFLLALVVFPLFGRAQDYGWWNDTHDWDGVSPWRSYLTLAPAFMGPNALPVPDVRNGRIEEALRLRVAGEAHFGHGDRTQNLYLEGHIPLFSDRVGLHLQYVPLERYAMTPTIRDERAARDFDGKGWASGDVYVATHVQLLRGHARLPDLLLAINLKTASGNKLSAARYTDTPGYSFDLSAGKTYPVGETELSVRPHAQIGFYVWQTFQDNYYQNDAVQYGLGCDVRFRGLTLTPALGGYYGYLGNGDRPLVVRLDLTTERERGVDYFLRLQRGLADYPYTSVRIGLNYRAAVTLQQ